MANADFQIKYAEFRDRKDGRYDGQPMPTADNFRTLIDKQMEIINTVNLLLIRLEGVVDYEYGKREGL